MAIDMSTPLPSTSAGVAIFVNQSGYDQGKPKVATITNTGNGVTATVKNADTGVTVATFTVTGNKIDLSSVDAPGLYRIECNGAISHNFAVGKYWNARVSTGPALGFMNHSRMDTFEQGRLGIGWRDSHQFSFELHTLVAQYAANPAAYTRMPYGIIETATSEYPELRTQDKPDIVWLIEFGARRYLDLATGGVRLHALVKEQLAYFLSIYPHIAQWVPLALYEDVRDLAVASWATVETDLAWYDTGSSNNLYLTQYSYGDTKGAEPPGHKIVPNLLMWEVAQRDGLPNAQAWLNAAVANAAWLVSLDPTAPLLTKGQRMSEHITMTGLCHLVEKYPLNAPAGAAAFIDAWADIILARSDNLWDYRMYTATAAGDASNRWVNTQNMNEPGNVAGLPAPLLAAARVITDTTKKAALRKLARAQFDQVFGRNPYRRHYSYQGHVEFEGVDVGYWDRYEGGNGVLATVPGVLDGNPPNAAYPFTPEPLGGYVEGWVAHNSAWHHALAYDAADDVTLSVIHPTAGTNPLYVEAGDTVTLRLRAPLNFDETTVETGWVEVAVDGGAPTQVAVTETSADGWDFEASWTVPAGSAFTVTYGYGLFRQEVLVGIGGPPPDPEPPAESGLFTTDGSPVSLARTNGDPVSLTA